MKRAFLIGLLIVALTSPLASGIAAAADNTISFEMLSHLLLVRAKINDAPEDYNFVIDTGGLTFIDKAVADDLQLKQQGMMAKINRLDLSGFEIDDIFSFTTFDFSRFDVLGAPVHGIIGSNLMERFTMTFDFRAQTVTFASDTTSPEIPEDALCLPFENHPVNNAPLIDIQIGERKMKGMIDTGQPYPLVLPLASVDAYKEEASEVIKSNGLMEEWPGTTVDHNYLTRLKTFTFGTKTLENTLCLFAQIPQPLSMPLIGNDLLSQFKIIIDYPKDTILLFPLPDAHIRDNLFSIGLHPDVSEDGKIIVKGIWDSSPAAEAGILPGDAILSFDSKTAAPENIIELIKSLENDSVTTIDLEIANKDKTRKITLTKAMVF